MSKEVRDTVVIVLVMLVVVCGVVAICSDDRQYTLDGVVSEVHYKEVRIVDTNGEEWVWTSDSYYFQEGCEVVLTMNNNCTDDVITDDYIYHIEKK